MFPVKAAQYVDICPTRQSTAQISIRVWATLGRFSGLLTVGTEEERMTKD